MCGIIGYIGDKDISSHVNFSELKDIALKYKLKILTPKKDQLPLWRTMLSYEILKL